MPSLSRAILVVGILMASLSFAEAGNKAAFNAPTRDAMPDITPLVARLPAPPPTTADTAPSTGAKNPRAKPARRFAKASPAKVAPVTRAIATEASAKPVPAPQSQADSPAAPAAASAAAGSTAAPSAEPSRSADQAPAAVDASKSASGGKTESAAATPGPPPALHAEGPREHGSETVADLVARHALANGVPLRLAEAVVTIESRGNAHASHAGALGLMQIKFGTARAAGFGGPAVGLFVADTNLRYGMKILGDAYRAAGGDTCGALMRYQSGHLATHMNHANHVYCSRARAIMAGA